MAVTMLSAYYSKGCHSEKLFAGLKISQNEFFKVHLNKYNVIFLDIQRMYGNALEEMKRNSTLKVMSYIQEQVIAELRNEYPECVQDDDVSLPSVLAKINVMTKEQFIIIIDEWDCLFREDKNNESLQKEYINLLRGLFKERGTAEYVSEGRGTFANERKGQNKTGKSNEMCTFLILNISSLQLIPVNMIAYE